MGDDQELARKVRTRLSCDRLRARSDHSYGGGTHHSSYRKDHHLGPSDLLNR